MQDLSGLTMSSLPDNSQRSTPKVCLVKGMEFELLADRSFLRSLDIRPIAFRRLYLPVDQSFVRSLLKAHLQM
jgi:hypothetical protein